MLINYMFVDTMGDTWNSLDTFQVLVPNFVKISNESYEIVASFVRYGIYSTGSVEDLLG